MRWSQVRGLEIIDTANAETAGHLDGLVIDPHTQRVTALVTDSKVVSWQDAQGIGNDAVTVSSRDLLRDPESDLESAAADGKTEPWSKPLFTEDGFAIGSLDDIDFDPQDGSIRRLVLDDGDDIAGERLLGIGSYAVMVSSPDHSESSGQASGDTGGSRDLHDHSRKELYEMARSRDIEGRSRMTKDDLIDALS